MRRMTHAVKGIVALCAILSLVACSSTTEYEEDAYAEREVAVNTSGGLCAPKGEAAICHEESELICETGEERVLSEECGGYVLVPAQYETVYEEVVVAPATVRKEAIEPVYETRCDTVLATPGRWEEKQIPAVFKDVEECILVEPARKEWRKVPCVNVNLAPGEQRGDAFCLVEIPAKYEKKMRKVLCEAARVERLWIEPTFKTVERKVLVSAGYEKEFAVPAQIERRAKQVMVSGAHWEWRWGHECPPGETDAGPKAGQPSPPPPFPVNTALPPGTEGSPESAPPEADTPDE